jgi:hypothetical protein
MICLRSAWRACQTLVLSAVCWTFLEATALADGAQQSQKMDGNWIISYCLVGAAIGASLTLVLRPNRRRDRARSE